MKRKPRLAIFVHHPQCEIPSAHGIAKALWPIAKVDYVDQKDLVPHRLGRYDMLAVPGGLGDADSWYRIMLPYADSVRNYVAQGGKYLGICMGAYWAGAEYFGLLHNQEPVQWIKRPRADVKRSWPTTADVDWLGRKERMYFYDGCAFIGTGRAKVVARYSNGDTAALIQRRVGVIGPHPESDQHWYDRSHLAPHWHQEHHRALLQEFAKCLLNQ